MHGEQYVGVQNVREQNVGEGQNVWEAKYMEQNAFKEQIASMGLGRGGWQTHCRAKCWGMTKWEMHQELMLLLGLTMHQPLMPWQMHQHTNCKCSGPFHSCSCLLIPNS